MITKKHNFFNNLEEANFEIETIRRIANALVKTADHQETCDLIVKECKEALKADAICLFLLAPNSDEEYDMVAEIGCTTEFKRQWQRIHRSRLPLANLINPYEAIFIGSPAELKREVTNVEKLVDQSGRKVIGYAPMAVGGNSIGVIGFSYNSVKNLRPDEHFITVLVSMCTQGLERARLVERERLARKEAEKANMAKTNFLASMSHEIRTPIGIIKGFADLMYKSVALPEKEKKWVLRIKKNAEHLAALIGDILDISKIEAKKIEVSKRFFSISELIDDVKIVIGIKAEERAVTLEFHCSDPKTRFYSDPIHLRQIMINLISNAVKFSPRQGVVRVNVEANNSQLRVLVVDNGVGIPQEQHLSIFEPFNKVSTSLSNRPAGTGLGLSISKYLAEAIGGNLRLLESRENMGSTFVVEIPCANPPLDSGAHATKANGGRLKNAKILVIDDSEDNLVLLQHVLSMEGGRVEVANNGLIGVQKAMASDYKLVIMDLQMPEMDGIQAVNTLRSKGFITPVVALTAEVEFGVREKVLKCGFDEYLSKPFDLGHLVKTLEQFVN